MPPAAVSQTVQLLPLFVLGLIVLGYYLRRQLICRQQLQGVRWLQAMRILLTHIQKHRGLSAGMISGDRSLIIQLEEAQQLISRDLAHIASVGDWVKDNVNWLAVTAHWARLAGRLHSAGLFNNIDQHNRLIKNILVFIDDIATEHYLTKDVRGAPNNWRELLQAAESVGQARALGTALTAGGKYFDLALKTRAELVQVMISLEELLEKTHLPLMQRQAVGELLIYIKTRVLVTDHTSAGDFFSRATECLDSILLAFDNELTRVHENLSQRRTIK
ncbi:MAG TPA: nitrate- and nitrite sensing domain-containing protein [Cellvibrionaceae bacterium]